ncbi:unnamed protein product [Discosporangium mesarthrocarpum]
MLANGATRYPKISRGSVLLAVMLVATCFSRSRTVAAPQVALQPAVGSSAQLCPLCELLFPTLNHTAGLRLGHVMETQLRGEPKSGTTMFFEAATSALKSTCQYLRHYFGEESCTCVRNANTIKWVFTPPSNTTSSALCSCPSINRSEPRQDATPCQHKHTLPLSDACSFLHQLEETVGASRVAMPTDKPPCTNTTTSSGGGTLGNAEDVEECVKDLLQGCVASDSRMQMTILRDPRAVAVSGYFNLVAQGLVDQEEQGVDDWVLSVISYLCWKTVLRYTLFRGLLRRNSAVFFYEDMQEDPTSFLQDMLQTWGLNMPLEVARQATECRRAIYNVHPGGVAGQSNTTQASSFRDELREDTVEQLNEYLRRALPAHLVALGWAD